MTDEPSTPTMTPAEATGAEDARRLRRIVWILTGVAAVLVGVLAVMLVIRSSDDGTTTGEYVSPWKGAVQLPDPIPAPTESFPGIDGTKVPLVKTAPGTVNVLFFGYTECPDVCPLSMQALSAALKKLSAAERSKIRVTFVTVDPARDTPEVLGKWLTKVSPSFVGVIPTLDESNAVLTRMGYAKTQKQEMPDGNGYAVAHPGSIFLFTDDGAAHLIFTMNNTPDEMAADLRKLLGGWTKESE